MAAKHNWIASCGEARCAKSEEGFVNLCLVVIVSSTELLLKVIGSSLTGN